MAVTVVRIPTSSQIQTFLTQSSASTIYATRANFPEGEWIKFTSNTTNINGSSSNLSFYTKVGKTVFVRSSITLGGSLTGNPTFSLPIAPRNSYVDIGGTTRSLTQELAGNCLLRQNGYATFPGLVFINNSGFATCSTFYAVPTYASLNNLNATTPFQWAALDSIYLQYSYESV